MPREGTESALGTYGPGDAGPVELLLEDMARSERVVNHLLGGLDVVHVDVSLLVGTKHPAVFHRDAGTAEGTVLTAETRWVNEHPWAHLIYPAT
jgi:hypothetical protein